MQYPHIAIIVRARLAAASEGCESLAVVPCWCYQQCSVCRSWLAEEVRLMQQAAYRLFPAEEVVFGCCRGFQLRPGVLGAHSAPRRHVAGRAGSLQGGDPGCSPSHLADAWVRAPSISSMAGRFWVMHKLLSAQKPFLLKATSRDGRP